MSETNQTPTSDGSVSDAVRGNWVDTRAPGIVRPYLRLSRVDRPIGTWLLLLPCWWGLGLAVAADDAELKLFDLWIFAGCGLGALLMRGAGCTWNDITDREYDAAVARTRSRPLPSGQVTLQQALIWMVIQALLAFAILLTFPPIAVILGVFSLPLVCIYPFAKRITWWPQIFLGLAFNWGVLVAWAAHSVSLSWPAVSLYAAGIAWTLFYDTIYALQDCEDDALIGIKSTARLFGAQAGRWLLGFQALSTGLVVLSIIAAIKQPTALAIALLGALGYSIHLSWQLRRLDTSASALCLVLFRSNRDAGLILASAFLIAALF